MADDVIITIGATIAQLQTAVQQASAQIQTLGTTAQQVNTQMQGAFAQVHPTIKAVGTNAQAASQQAGSAFEELGKKIVEFFAVEKVVEFMHSLMELGRQTSALATVFGTSTEDIAGMELVAKNAGMDVDRLAQASERLMVRIQRASSEGFSPATQVLNQLNLTAKDFAGLGSIARLALFADRMHAFGNETGAAGRALETLLGRNIKLNAVILEGGDAIRKQMEEGKKLAGLTTEQTESLKKAEEQWNRTSLAIRGTFVSALMTANDWMDRSTGKINDWLRNAGVLRFLPGAGGRHEPEGPPAPPTPPKPEMKDTVADLQKEIEKKIQAVNQEVAIEKGGFDRQKALLDAYVSSYGMTEYEKVVKTGEINVQIAQSEVDALTKKMELWKEGSLEWKKLETERVVATQKVQTEIQQSNVKTVVQIQKDWESVGHTISGAFSSQLRGLLDGTTTWAQAMRNTILNLIEAAIKAVEELAVKWVASLLATKTSVLPLIMQNVGQAYAGFAAFFAPLLGPGAPAAAAALSAQVQATATGLAALAEGTDFVPRTGLAVLHQGEMVIPSSVAAQLRDAASAGGGGTSSSINFHITAWDGQSVQGWLRGGGAKMIAQHFDRNPASRMSY